MHTGMPKFDYLFLINPKAIDFHTKNRVLYSIEIVIPIGIWAKCNLTFSVGKKRVPVGKYYIPIGLPIGSN